jgi:hypothetical protein
MLVIFIGKIRMISQYRIVRVRVRVTLRVVHLVKTGEQCNMSRDLTIFAIRSHNSHNRWLSDAQVVQPLVQGIEFNVHVIKVIDFVHPSVWLCFLNRSAFIPPLVMVLSHVLN